MPVKIARSTPSTIVRAARAAGSQPHLASGFQGRCKIATLHADFGVIRGMSVERWPITWTVFAPGAFLPILVVFVVAVFVRSVMFQAFNIPAGSMKPSILVGDYILISKFSYGYGAYSFPGGLGSTINGRIFGVSPERGDVVVFRLPKDVSTDCVRRVIGLPGDRIQMIDGLLHINGNPVKRERISDFIEDKDSGGARVKRWRETLSNGVSYETLDLVDNGLDDN